ncbi:Tat pathway signal protein [Brevibacillus porteri]|uniref:Tat pathway signal protein n=1 Tax=Brevibacillus porteri TaxID=2126350 RepID=UPI00370B5645
MALTPLPQSVIQMMASKEHRLWHYLWHGLRNSWEQLTPEERQSILDVYPGWQPPRPALDSNRRPLRDNNSGEDFLYMHREMIMMVNAVLANEGNPNYPWVQGWKKVPRPGDSDYPVPPAYSIGDTDSDKFIQTSKTDFWTLFARLEERFMDLDFLRSVTLGQLGSDIEWSIHGGMHGRWSAESPMGYRPDSALNEPVNDIWNQPEYNWLFDTYSSHVNPIFWKMHGWVDDRIDDWKRANKIDDYEWKGTWMGDPIPHGPHHHRALMEAPGEIEKFEQIAGILASTGKWRGFFFITE